MAEPKATRDAPAVLDETHLSGIIATWGSKVLYALVGLCVVVVGAAFSAGWYMAAMMTEVQGMRGDVQEVRGDVHDVTELVRGQFDERLRALELATAPGILEDAKRQFEEVRRYRAVLERRMDAVERQHAQEDRP